MVDLTGHAQRKLDGYTQTRTLLLQHPEGVAFGDLVAANGGRESTTWRYLREMNARVLRRGVYTLDPNAADIELAHAIIRRIGDKP